MKIVTFNAGLVSLPFFAGRYAYELTRFVNERLRKMPEILASAEADILFLQEVYRIDHKQFFADALSKTFPYVSFSTRTSWLPLFGNSLMIFSKFPMLREEFIRFDAGRWDERLLTSQGFLVADMPETPLGRLRVCNVHTTAGVLTHPEHPKIDAVRMAQINQLVAHTRESQHDSSLILAGDFNCGPGVSSYTPEGIPPLGLPGQLPILSNERVSAANYRRILDLGFLDTFTSLGLQDCSTWSPFRNSLNAASEHASWGCPEQRIDHVFVEPGKLKACAGAVFLEENQVTTADGNLVPLSDHYGFWVDLARSE